MYIVSRVCMTGYRLSIARDPGPTVDAATQTTPLTLITQDGKPRAGPNVSAARNYSPNKCDLYKRLSALKDRAYHPIYKKLLPQFWHLILSPFLSNPQLQHTNQYTKGVPGLEHGQKGFIPILESEVSL